MQSSIQVLVAHHYKIHAQCGLSSLRTSSETKQAGFHQHFGIHRIHV
jgi:hypothetical protein